MRTVEESAKQEVNLIIHQLCNIQVLAEDSFQDKENYSSKLAGLSLAGGPYVEKDGSSEDNTLIHNAFVKYYDSKGPTRTG